MTGDRNFTRRSVLGSIAVSPVLFPGKLPEIADDSRLISLGDQFDALTARMDSDIISVPMAELEHFGVIYDEIAATVATTIDGIRVKARAVCWAQLGDLDYDDRSPVNAQMRLSIVRDLIRLYDPHLERPGALADLVKDIQSSAAESSKV